MELYGGINPYESFRFGFGYIDTIRQQRAAVRIHQQDASRVDRDQSIYTHQRVMRMREAVQAIKPEMLEQQSVQFASPAIATSGSSLSIDTTGTPAELQSTEEVNTTPTSFSPKESAWSGSTAQAMISGEYDGSNGTDTLTFRVVRSGVHGQNDLRIKVLDSGNNQIDQININDDDDIDRQYALNNGLVLTLGEGQLLKKDTFTIDVDDSQGSAVNPDKPFSGMGNDSPDLENGLVVTDGSFQINGTTISVQADDTLNTVLDRITQSDAGVTATFDAANEIVLMTQKTAGAGQDIVLTNDTSGFLAAVKLEGATTTPGKDPDTTKPLATVDRFSAVQSGNFNVNGVSIDIDVNTDSLNDVIDRISASGAGVNASFDVTSQRVTLRSENTASQMDLSSGSTNFFAAVQISEGTYNAADDLIQAPEVSFILPQTRNRDSSPRFNAVQGRNRHERQGQNQQGQTVNHRISQHLVILRPEKNFFTQAS
ncbi:MAG: hypothetical protein PVI00_05760, partial [Desulfobacterales bacterium]